MDKSPYGSPCNSCGLCCRHELCPLASYVFHRTAGPCPALEVQADDRQLCGLILNPQNYAPILSAIHGREKMSKAAAHLNGAGGGCDCRDYGEKEDPAFNAKMEREADRDEHKSFKAMKTWGVNV